ncbi:MAG: tRNA epoxyqueuosine(34) reductase QueG [unclassified Hahellaceae]|mgnify:CR=1 FL=1|nr:tRNA epoxyqueuosine(34) reductase QueG [Hahellaceae bacterium]|tara:strand:+ start:81152 stop:82285 length:1134 start_codon:yes stop_codon:yes gene_type:complete
MTDLREAPSADPLIMRELRRKLDIWANELGFQQLGVSGIQLGDHPEALQRWLDKGYHGQMSYMAERASLRAAPETLFENAASIISVRMDFWPAKRAKKGLPPALDDGETAYVASYALGRDYHKLMRSRLKKLADRVRDFAGDYDMRPFVDSAPVLERGVAQQAGLGWIGKNTMLINPAAGSHFFLGELFTSLPLPADKPFTDQHCGSCRACLDVCPTSAFPEPGVLDARRCISYLTIEHRGSIDEALRPLMGNRVFGCDDCQAICPWNKFAHFTKEADFHPRQQISDRKMVELFNWSEETFLKQTEGSAIRRTGYESWLRNLAIGLGNALAGRGVLGKAAPMADKDAIRRALETRLDHESAVVREHVRWALSQQAPS